MPVGPFKTRGFLWNEAKRATDWTSSTSQKTREVKAASAQYWKLFHYADETSNLNVRHVAEDDQQSAKHCISSTLTC